MLFVERLEFLVLHAVYYCKVAQNNLLQSFVGLCAKLLLPITVTIADVLVDE